MAAPTRTRISGGLTRVEWQPGQGRPPAVGSGLVTLQPRRRTGGPCTAGRTRAGLGERAGLPTMATLIPSWIRPGPNRRPPMPTAWATVHDGASPGWPCLPGSARCSGGGPRRTGKAPLRVVPPSVAAWAASTPTPAACAARRRAAFLAMVPAPVLFRPAYGRSPPGHTARCCTVTMWMARSA